MKVCLVGSGGPRPHKKRAAPSQAIFGKNSTVLIDCGPGAGHNLALLDHSLSEVSHLFLTHTHLDHCLELPAVILAGYLEGRKGAINIYGPPGTKAVVNALMSTAYGYVDALVKNVTGESVTIHVHELDDGNKLELDEWRVQCRAVDHNFPCLGYRFETAEGLSASFSGDTAPCDAVVDLARDSDILVHDCAFPDDMAEAARSSYHSTPAQVGEIAQSAKTKHAVLMHMFPACDGKENDMTVNAKSAFDGLVTVGDDMQVFSIDRTG